MRLTFLLASAALTSAAFTGPATAEDRLHLTPPLYREQAQVSLHAERLNVLATTPQPVPSTASSVRSTSKAGRSLDQASAEALR